MKRRDARRVLAAILVSQIPPTTVLRWQAKDFPPKCTKQNSPTDKTDCALWCDDQSCDPCHPNNNGYVKMASIMKQGLGL